MCVCGGVCTPCVVCVCWGMYVGVWKCTCVVCECVVSCVCGGGGVYAVCVWCVCCVFVYVCRGVCTA